MKPTFFLRSILLITLILAAALFAEISPSRDISRGLAAGISLLALIGFLLVRDYPVFQGAADPASPQELPNDGAGTGTHAQPDADKTSSASNETVDALAAVAEETYDIETIRTVEGYLKQFYYRYKGFYGDIQRIPVQANEAQTQAIRRQLVEMGIHALSFARAFRLEKLTRLNDEPNIRIILEQSDIDHLEKSAYRLYTDDPYKTEKRYHILRKIFQEMDLERLDVLLETVYISPEFLKKP